MTLVCSATRGLRGKGGAEAREPMKRVSSIEYGVLGMDAGSGGWGFKLKGKPETGKDVGASL
jgi:hypothetical protein